MDLETRLSLAAKLGVPLNSDGYIQVPYRVTHLKLDIGLSYSAPHALAWLRDEPWLFVVGVEPIADNVTRLHSTLHSTHNADIRERFLVIPCAVGAESGELPFFFTDDPGQASFLRPVQHSFGEVRPVVVETVDRIMGLIEPGRFTRIDYIKTDCQGWDHNVLVGSRDSLRQAAIVTIEAPTKAYDLRAGESLKDPAELLKNSGFAWVNRPSSLRSALRWVLRPLIRSSSRLSSLVEKAALDSSSNRGNVRVIDPTFLNLQFASEVRKGTISALQFN